jgi:D-glycero-D-manno-heptose 1,7-bisphosphate phosphatase
MQRDMNENRRRFVLLDRDGTIITERHYLADPAGVEMLPGAGAALKRLKALGLGLVVITNQSGIARGFFDVPQLHRIHARLSDLLRHEGVGLDGIYWCPHRPEDACDCRKPDVALPHMAAGELEFQPEDAFVIGDKECDIEMGRRLGATTFLVLTGYGQQTATAGRSQPALMVADLNEAADRIERLLAERG